MFESGIAADMGTRFLTWCYIRLNTDFYTGYATVPVSKISRTLKQTEATTYSHLAKLEEAGLIEIHKKGNRNVYKVIDKFHIEELTTGNDETEITVPYKPETFPETREDLKAFRENRASPLQLRQKGIGVDMPPVIINLFTINGDNNTINNLQVLSTDDESMSPKQIKEAIAELRKSPTKLSEVFINELEEKLVGQLHAMPVTAEPSS